ncbi:hypothetical protein F4859DRAFT_518512 [Xylaria cf. heliscus]|nr:hypothetical protein F4859DRAFT_518512 [Xylaria cf. heliscus]
MSSLVTFGRFQLELLAGHETVLTIASTISPPADAASSKTLSMRLLTVLTDTEHTFERLSQIHSQFITMTSIVFSQLIIFRLVLPANTTILVCIVAREEVGRRRARNDDSSAQEEALAQRLTTNTGGYSILIRVSGAN